MKHFLTKNAFGETTALARVALPSRPTLKVSNPRGKEPKGKGHVTVSHLTLGDYLLLLPHPGRPRELSHLTPALWSDETKLCAGDDVAFF